MALENYLAEEIALDHRDGLLSRRDALRLLALMGLGATAASSLLDAAPVGAASKKTTTRKRATTRAATTTTAKRLAGAGPALATTPITFPGPAGELRGTFAAAAGIARGAVLVIHENRGLTDHFKALPGRFARDGYSALAVDLASRVGGTDAVAAQMPAPLSSTPTADLVADAKAALTEQAKRAPGLKLGVVGFCFGGGMVWNVLASGEPRLAAAAPFYGTGPDGADFRTSSHAAVLAIYAEKDSRVLANRPAMEAAMKTASMTYQVRVFPGVDHAFFNDTGARYDAVQAAAAYEAVLAWFGAHLGAA